MSDELCRFKEEDEEEERQIVSSGDSHIKRVLDRLATLSIPTVRVEALDYIKSLIVCEFGGFENALRYAGIHAIPI